MNPKEPANDGGADILSYYMQCECVCVYRATCKIVNIGNLCIMRSDARTSFGVVVVVSVVYGRRRKHKDVVWFSPFYY